MYACTVNRIGFIILSTKRFYTEFRSSKMDIQTFVFLDLETTGIPWQESNKTKITEICLTVVDAKHLKPGVIPRAANKLNLCLNPRKMINIESTKLTGLSNDLLEFQPMFTHETAEVIKAFLNLHRKQLCLVAHNGNKFDYPILRAELEKCNSSFPEDILCVDSLELFKKIYEEEVTQVIEPNAVPIEFTPNYDSFLISAVEGVEQLEKRDAQSINETTPQKGKLDIEIKLEDLQSPSKQYYQPDVIINNEKNSSKKKLNFGYPSFKLGDIYCRYTKKEPIDTHRADGDVKMLIECASSCSTKFINLAKLHCKKLVDVPVMRPGIRIGT